MPSFPYEILFRLTRDGTIRGAHYKTLRVIEEPGEPDEEREGEAQRIAVGAAKDGLDLGPILGTLAAAQQATLDQQATAIAGHAAELAAKDANAQELLERIAALTEERDRLRIVVDAFHAETDSGSEQPGSAASSGDVVITEGPEPGSTITGDTVTIVS